MESSILNHFEDFFTARGFRCNPLRREYTEPTSYGYRRVLFSFGSMEDLGRLEISLGIYIEGVEKQVRQFVKGLRGYEGESPTFMTSLSLIAPDAPEFRINEVNKSENQRKLIAEILDRQGFPFLEKALQLQRLDELYNLKTGEDCPWVEDQFARCMRGLVVARLINRPDWRTLSTQLEAYLRIRKTPEKYLLRFGQLRDFLHTFSLN